MTSPLDRIPLLAAWLSASELQTLELVGPTGRVRLSRGEVPIPSRRALVPPARAERKAPETVAVRSPGVGTLLLAHPLHDRPLAAAGEDVAGGQTLALIRIGAALLPVSAPCSGTLGPEHREDGALVGYGDPLFAIVPAP